MMARKSSPTPRSRTRAARSSEVDYLEQRVDQLEGMFMGIAQANPVPGILIAGFKTMRDTMRDQLAPLGAMAPSRTHMRADQLARLQKTRDELARPNWGGPVAPPADLGGGYAQTGQVGRVAP